MYLEIDIPDIRLVAIDHLTNGDGLESNKSLLRTYKHLHFKVAWHNFDDLALHCSWFWSDMTSITVRKFHSLSFDTPHNARVTILSDTDPIVFYKMLKSKLHFGYLIKYPSYMWLYAAHY